MQKAYRIRLHVLSPVHIGCDDVYEPTGFVVDKARKMLVAFDPLDFVRSLGAADRRRFLDICAKGTLDSIQELYQFMSGQHFVSGHEVAVSDAFVRHYAEKIGLPAAKFRAELNKFSIGRTSYLPFDNAPYIPGSALKGALRTGWLNHVNQRARHDRIPPKELERKLLGGTFAGDPFRLVKVSDLLPLEKPATRICFAVNKKKMPSRYAARGPNQILEVIEPGGVFEGVLTLHTPEWGAEIRKENAVPSSDAFLKQALSFFGRELANEEQVLEGIGIASGTEKMLKGRLPVRLGRHSGAETLTVEGARSIKIMGKRGEPPKYGPHSTTIWLAADDPRAASGLLPFGWAALEVMPADAARPYPERIFTDRLTASFKEETERPSISEPSRAVSEQIVWDNATLTWKPGNAVLTASFEDKKAELKLSGDRSIVPEPLRKKLFEKKAAVPARVTIEKDGNLLTIVKLEI